MKDDIFSHPDRAEVFDRIFATINIGATEQGELLMPINRTPYFNRLKLMVHEMCYTTNKIEFGRDDTTVLFWRNGHLAYVMWCYPAGRYAGRHLHIRSTTPCSMAMGFHGIGDSIINFRLLVERCQLAPDGFSVDLTLEEFLNGTGE